jgi:hypothetical protein
VLACTLTAIVYQRTLDHPFVFDDRLTVLLNPALVDRWNIRGALLLNLARPVVNLSYMFDRGFWGFSSFGYHITNRLLHVLVVGLAVRLGSDWGKSGARHRSDPTWAAFFAITAFALHPLMSSTVLYVSARSDLLCAALFLLTLTFTRRAILSSSAPAGVMAVVSGLLALASGPAAAALPIVVLMYDAWVLADGGWKQRMTQIYVPAAGVVALAAAWQLPAVLDAIRVPPRGLLMNLLTEGLVIWRYVVLLVAPVGQSIVHEVHWVESPLDVSALLALVCLGVSVAAAIRIRRDQPTIAFGVVWFAVTLLPTSSVFPLRDGMAEHRAYLPALGLFLAAGSALAGPFARQRAARAVGASLLVVLAMLTVARAHVWREPLAVWKEAVHRAPEAWQAHLGYADVLRELNECEPARQEYLVALQLYPGNPDAQTGLATCR